VIVGKPPPDDALSVALGQKPCYGRMSVVTYHQGERNQVKTIPWDAALGATTRGSANFWAVACPAEVALG
jgi:hypothetical protein